jgi:hypothetical protein
MDSQIPTYVFYGHGMDYTIPNPETGEANYRITNRGGKGVKTMNVTDKTGFLVGLLAVTEQEDLMITCVSGVTIRMSVKAISELLSNLASLGEIKAVGLAVPGALDEKNGISRWSGNLGWRNLPIRDLLAREINIPVAFGHDVRTGALAELRNGAAKGVNNAIFIP